jgi:hypothetical protein
MKNNTDDALQMLNAWIEKGCEYPDAEFKVAWELNLSPSQVDQLRQLYDEQPTSDIQAEDPEDPNPIDDEPHNYAEE